MDLICLVLIGAGAIVGLALGIILESRLSGREIERLKERLKAAGLPST